MVRLCCCESETDTNEGGRGRGKGVRPRRDQGDAIEWVRILPEYSLSSKYFSAFAGSLFMQVIPDGLYEGGGLSPN